MWPRIVLIAALAGIAVFVPAAGGAERDGSTVIVQGTTDVRDSNLLASVIVPAFAAAYPQYTLKYIAVGSGQAIVNAEAGQGDVVFTHAPPEEAKFVADHYSYTPAGQAIFYSDYVI